MPPSLPGKEQDDTIIVKGKYSWSRPSSPDSTTPEIRPMGATLPAQIESALQHLESPEPLDSSSTANPDLSNSRPDQPAQPDQSEQPDHLDQQAQHDQPDLHDQQDPLDFHTPSKRQRYNGTTMEERLQMMPEKRAMPWRPGVEPGAELETGGDSRRKQIRFGCLLATRGDVVPVPCNSCANGRGKFKVCVALDGYFKGACASCQLSGRPNRCSIKKNDDIKGELDSPTGDTPGGEITHSNGKHQPSTGAGPQPKRRRTEAVPDWDNVRPQWEPEIRASQPPQPQMNDMIQRPWATVNPPASTPTPLAISERNNDTKSVPRSAGERSGSMGWVTVNQPAMTPAPRPLKNGMESNGSGIPAALDMEAPEGPANEDGSSGIIDSLPKNKQRQIYSLVSGLQGGIEHLQRELDSLKKALGIADD